MNKMNKIMCLVTVITVTPIIAMVGNVGPTEGYAYGNVGPAEGYTYANVGQNQDSETPQFNDLSDEDRQLIIAVDSGNASQVEQLLAKGANARLRIFSGESMTALAARKGYTQILKLLNDSLTREAKL